MRALTSMLQPAAGLKAWSRALAAALLVSGAAPAVAGRTDVALQPGAAKFAQTPGSRMEQIQAGQPRALVNNPTVNFEAARVNPMLQAPLNFDPLNTQAPMRFQPSLDPDISRYAVPVAPNAIEAPLFPLAPNFGQPSTVPPGLALPPVSIPGTAPPAAQPQPSDGSGAGTPSARTDITAGQGGLGALIVPSMKVSGVLRAQVGKSASGNGFTLDLYGDQLIRLVISDKVMTRLTDVRGTPLKAFVPATGAGRPVDVLITAATAKTALDNVINTGPVTEATSFRQQGRRIVLMNGAQRIATEITAARPLSRIGEVRLPRPSSRIDPVLVLVRHKSAPLSMTVSDSLEHIHSWDPLLQVARVIPDFGTTYLMMSVHTPAGRDAYAYSRYENQGGGYPKNTTSASDSLHIAAGDNAHPMEIAEITPGDVSYRSVSDDRREAVGYELSWLTAGTAKFADLGRSTSNAGPATDVFATKGGAAEPGANRPGVDSRYFGKTVNEYLSGGRMREPAR